MFKQAQELHANTKQHVSLVTGKIRPFGNECGRNKAYELRLGDNYTNGSARSLPLCTLFPKRDLSPWFLLYPPSPQPWLPPWVTASGAHVTSALTPASPRPRQKRGRESCRVVEREGGVRANISASTLRRPDRRVLRVSTK